MGLRDSIKKLTNTLGISQESSPSSSENEDIDLARLQESSSESDIESDDSSEEVDDEDQLEEEEEEEEEEDVALSEAEVDDDADVIPYQKMTINNIAAIQRSLKTIQLPASAKSSFIEHLSITASEPMVLKDIYDDTERELAFYKQALDAAKEARELAKRAGVPFSRPVDYFAEMVKSDEHMNRLKNKLIQDEKEKLGAQEARKQRELKKYGKKVQHEKLQQRQKDKREMLDKINGLKRKRKDMDASNNDEFDVQLEDAIGDKKKSRDDKFKLGNKAKQPNRKRLAKNSKYGSGHRRGDRKNTSESSMDMSGFRNKRRK